MPTRDGYRVLQGGVYFEVCELENAETELRKGVKVNHGKAYYYNLHFVYTAYSRRVASPSIFSVPNFFCTAWDRKLAGMAVS